MKYPSVIRAEKTILMIFNSLNESTFNRITTDVTQRMNVIVINDNIHDLSFLIRIIITRTVVAHNDTDGKTKSDNQSCVSESLLLVHNINNMESS